MQDACARWVVVHLVRNLDVQSIDEYVAKAITSGNGCVIDHRRARDPARLTVVRENEQAVFWSFINSKVNRLLHVTNENAGALGVESNDRRAESLMTMNNRFKGLCYTTDLVLGFSQHFFLTNIIDPQGFPHSCNQTTLESKKRKRNVIYFRLRDVSSQRKCDPEIFTL